MAAMKHVIEADLTDKTYVTVSGLWQWDYGQILRIIGLELDASVEVHFSLTRNGESLSRAGAMHDGYTDVEIPNSLLKSGSGYIYAWVYVNDKESGYTIRSIDIRVQSRAKPGNWNPPTDAPEESTKTYTYVQTVPASTWTINHKRGRMPAVSVVDSAGSIVYGDVDYIDSNTIRVTFSGAFAGKAYLN